MAHVAEPLSSRMISPRSGQDTLPAQLEARYGIQVAQLTELDLGVYRVGRRDGPDWVARVFAADRPLAAAEGDAALLRRLEQQEFPPSDARRRSRSSRMRDRASWSPGTWRAPGRTAAGGPSAGWAACSAGCTCCPVTTPVTAEAGIT